MTAFEVAHVRVRGVDLVLVPVAPAFARDSHAGQLAAAADFGRYAAGAGLAGEAVPVWPDGRGGMSYFARPSLHPAVGGLSWEFVRRRLNYRLVVGRAGPGRRPRPDPAGQTHEDYRSPASIAALLTAVAGSPVVGEYSGATADQSVGKVMAAARRPPCVTLEAGE